MKLVKNEPMKMQSDDGSRNAIDAFMDDVDKNTSNFLRILLAQNEYWKARVFLELIWDYQKNHPTRSTDPRCSHGVLMANRCFDCDPNIGVEDRK